MSVPVVPYLKVPSDGGEPYLEGVQCRECGAISLAARMACPRCGQLALSPHRLSSEGKLYSYSIVYRTFPGVEVPFVSAVVDLEGGGSVKGNLVGVPFDPARIPFGMPVRVAFRSGERGATFVFEPRESAR